MTDNQTVLLINSPICRLCQNVYKNPKVLSCLHSFCCGCLELQQGRNLYHTEVKCPICSESTPIPPGGLKKLTNNAFLNRISQDYVESVKNTITNKSPTYHTNLPTAFTYSKKKVEKVDCSDDTLSAEDKHLAAKILDKLQSEIVHLQQEALSTTYGIEAVTDIVSNWKLTNSELKSTIQQRSALLQHIIKRREKDLIAQVESQEYNSKFVQDTEEAKGDLRQNLKNAIKAVEFVKQVQEFATEEDIVEMQTFLQKKLATLKKVSINLDQYSGHFPDVNITERIEFEFGALTSSQIQNVVYDLNINGEPNIKADIEETQDTRNVPKKLNFRRKMNKERRLTSVVEKDWKSEETKQSKDNLSELRDNIIQRRRRLLHGFGSFEHADAQRVHFQRNLPDREAQKRKRRYHSLGGRSEMSAAPPDSTMLKNLAVASAQSGEPPNTSSSSVTTTNVPAINYQSTEITKIDSSCYLDEEPVTSYFVNEIYKVPILHEVVPEEAEVSPDEEWTVVTEEVVVHNPNSIDTNVSSEVLSTHTNTFPIQKHPAESHVSLQNNHTEVNSNQSKSNYSQSETNRLPIDSQNDTRQSNDDLDQSQSEWTFTEETVIYPTQSFENTSSNISSTCAKMYDVTNHTETTSYVTDYNNKNINHTQRNIMTTDESISPKDNENHIQESEFKICTNGTELQPEDKETKINFLRTSWQKRKDILKEKDGFISPVEETTDSSATSGQDVDKSNLHFVYSSCLEENNSEKQVPPPDSPNKPSENSGHAEKNDFSNIDKEDDSTDHGLTRFKLHEYRDNRRQKLGRWRVETS